MKKLILFASMLTVMTQLSAQTNTATPANTNVQAPTAVSTRFSNDYPNMQPTWSMDGNNYRADYLDGMSNHSIIYDQKGKMLSTEEQLAKGAYPSTIGDYYTEKHPGEKYEVWSSTNKDGEMTYYTKRNSETIWFNKDGKYKTTTTNKIMKK